MAIYLTALSHLQHIEILHFISTDFTAGEDFVDNPMILSVTPTIGQQACFTYSIVNDDIYEVNEEFFINLTTTDPSVTLMPNHRIIIVSDDDSELPPPPPPPPQPHVTMLAGSQSLNQCQFLNPPPPPPPPPMLAGSQSVNSCPEPSVFHVQVHTLSSQN